LGVIGLAFVFSPTTSQVQWIALFGALISGLSAGLAVVSSKRIQYNATQSTLTLWAASTVANFLMAFVVREPMPASGWHPAWFYLVCFAIASVCASWALIRGVKLIDAGTAGVIGLLEIVFGVLFGVAFFQERPAPIALAGIVIIIAAAAIPYFRPKT